MTDFAAARQAMVDCQVRPSDVTRYAIIEAMLWAPRELFVPKARRDVAYAGAEGESPRVQITRGEHLDGGKSGGSGGGDSGGTVGGDTTDSEDGQRYRADHAGQLVEASGDTARLR